MSWHQTQTVEGKTVRIKPMFLPEETWTFATEEEAQGRAGLLAEALDWVKTPFVDCCDIKGPKGGVDCAMYDVRVFSARGLIPADFDPRPYSPDHMRHRSEEHFLGFIRDTLHAREVEKPQIGDVPLWQFGRVFSHCGIVINSQEFVHAFKRAGMVMVSRLDDDYFRFIATHASRWPRPVKYFDVWSR
jgi:cell wall-associated NlpC family hydrolase